MSAFDSRFSSLELIEKDLRVIFEYIEPVSANYSAYSHRTYELFLRMATEFENCVEKYLRVHEPNLRSKPNMTDYIRILNYHPQLKTNKICLKIHIKNLPTGGLDLGVFINPLDEWDQVVFNSQGQQNVRGLDWYQDYNRVKHDRESDFNLANLGNLIKAYYSLVLLHYGIKGRGWFTPYASHGQYATSSSGLMLIPGAIFTIKFS